MPARAKTIAHQVAERISVALQHDGLLSKAAAQEAAFHFTDWLDDLAELNELFWSTDWDPKRAQGVLMDFSTHAPAHIAALQLIVAGTPVTDVFEIGAVKGTGRAKRQPGEPYPPDHSKPPKPKKKKKKKKKPAKKNEER